MSKVFPDRKDLVKLFFIINYNNVGSGIIGNVAACFLCVCLVNAGSKATCMDGSNVGNMPLRGIVAKNTNCVERLQTQGNKA